MNERKWVIDKNSVIPLYFQVKEYLKNQIQGGIYKEDEMIPSERELPEEFEINRLTVRQAINDLVQEGFLNRQRGVIYELTKELYGMEMENVSLYKTLESVCGLKLVKALQSIEIVTIRLDEATLLDIDPRDPVMQIERTTFTQNSDKPVEYVCSYYRADRYKFIIEMNV